MAPLDNGEWGAIDIFAMAANYQPGSYLPFWQEDELIFSRLNMVLKEAIKAVYFASLSNLLFGWDESPPIQMCSTPLMGRLVLVVILFSK